MTEEWFHFFGGLNSMISTDLYKKNFWFFPLSTVLEPRGSPCHKQHAQLLCAL